MLSWLREGDANSKYFHSALFSRRRRNCLGSILVEGYMVEDVKPVRHAVFSYFVAYFQAQHVVRSGVDNLQLRVLSFAVGSSLIKPFSVEEVKATVWDCDSFKSQGPDGINFGFIKDFWLDLKDDITRFVLEFH